MWKWFVGIEDLKSLQKAYIKLAKQHHPDVGGSDKIMKEINTERDKLKELLENGCDVHSFTHRTRTQQSSSQTRYRRYTPPKNEKPYTLDELLRERQRKGYKKGWVAARALEYATSYEDCLKIARALYYKDGWAWYKWQEILTRKRNAQ